MNTHELLNCRRLPGRIDAQQTAALLGFREQPDIQVLMRARLLKPLGNPARNGVKYFASAVVLQLAADEAWLHKATGTIQRFWRSKHREAEIWPEHGKEGASAGCLPKAATRRTPEREIIALAMQMQGAGKISLRRICFICKREIFLATQQLG